MSFKTSISGIVATSLGLKNINHGIEWREVKLPSGKALVPNKNLVSSIDFDWIKDRLLCLYDGAIVRIDKRTYRLGLMRRSDAKVARRVINRNTRFWVRSVNPRQCAIGPRKGVYDRLANEEDEDNGLFIVLYRIEGIVDGAKAIINGWARSLSSIIRRVAKRIGLYATAVWDHCKGFRMGHERSEHERYIGPGEEVEVKACFVRGHYYGESLAA